MTTSAAITSVVSTRARPDRDSRRSLAGTVTAGRIEHQSPAGRPWAIHRWPTAAGILLAASFAAGISFGFAGSTDIAQVVTASGFVYLGAAALGRRMAAWPLFLVSFGLITIGFVVPGFDPSLWMLGTVAILVVYGLVQGGLRTPWGIPLQAAAMIVLAAVAITAANLVAPWAGLVVSTALFGHAAWDIYHHRVDRVVARSMAEFCGVLDTLLALVVLVVTFTR